MKTRTLKEELADTAACYEESAERHAGDEQIHIKRAAECKADAARCRARAAEYKALAEAQPE